MTPDMHAYYAQAGIIPKPLAFFSAPVQRVVSVSSDAGVGDISAGNPIGRGLTSAVPLSAAIQQVGHQMTVPWPFTIIPGKYR